MKYLMRIKITTRKLPIYTRSDRNTFSGNGNDISNSHHISIGSSLINISQDGKPLYYDDVRRQYFASSLETHPEYILYNIFGEFTLYSKTSGGIPPGGGGGCNISTSESLYNKVPKYPQIGEDSNLLSCCRRLLLYNNNLYSIEPIYEYPKYSLDDEINDIFKRRYRKKHNTYFIQLIKTILLLNKDDLICAYIKNSYKLLPDIKEDEYKYIEHIIIKNEPKFNNKYLIKYLDDEIELYENV